MYLEFNVTSFHVRSSVRKHAWSSSKLIDDSYKFLHERGIFQDFHYYGHQSGNYKLTSRREALQLKRSSTIKKFLTLSSHRGANHGRESEHIFQIFLGGNSMNITWRMTGDYLTEYANGIPDIFLDYIIAIRKKHDAEYLLGPIASLDVKADRRLNKYTHDSWFLHPLNGCALMDILDLNYSTEHAAHTDDYVRVFRALTRHTPGRAIKRKTNDLLTFRRLQEPFSRKAALSVV